MKKIFFLFIGLMLCTAAFAQTAKAVKYPTTFYVSPNGTGNGYDKETPTTLQGAVDSIYNRTVSKNVNFTVVLLDVVDNYGTSSDSVKIIQQENKNITIKSQKAKSPANVGLKFYIDGTNRFDGQEKLVLQDLSFVNEGGIKLWYHTVPETSYVHNITVQNCAFSGNSTHYGLYFQCLNSQSAAYSSCGGRNITIEDCSFVGRENDVYIGRIDTVKINNCKLSGCKKGIEVMFSNNEGRNGYLNMSNTDITMNSQNNEFAFSLGYSTDQPNLQKNFTAIVENSNFYGSSLNSGLVRLQKNCPKNLIFKNVALNVSDSSVALNLPKYSDPDFLLNITVSSGLLVINGDLQIAGVSKTAVNHTAIKGVDSYSLFSFNSNSKFYQWKDNQWKEKDTVYVFPEGVTHDITNVVAECKMPDMPLFCFSSVSDAVEFMTISDSSMYLMNTLGLDSVGVNIIKNNTLARTITVSTGKNVTLLDDKAIVTRGDTMKNSPMIVNNGKLTINTLSAEDTLIFDGGNYDMHNYFANIVVNNGTLTLAGNVQFKNNKAGWKIPGGGSAILNKDSLSIKGKVVFENNYSYQSAGAILNDNNSKMNISGHVEFVNNESRIGGGALYLKNGSKAEIEESAVVNFDGNKSANGGAINVDFNATLTVDGSINFKRNVAPRGATLVNGGTTNINGNIVVKGDTSYNSGVITSAGTLNIKNGEITENVLYIDSADYNNGTIVVEHNSTVLVGGKIHKNIFINRTLNDLYPLPASVVITSTGSQSVTLGGNVEVDTITLVIAGDFNQKVFLNSGLTAVDESNPIVLQLDSLDKQVLDRQWVADASDNATRIATNYMKFKPSSDTLAINNKGYVVRKPEINIDTVYLLQKGTKYEDYGITTITGEVDMDKIYVEYTQTVDAHGNDNTIKSDSTIIKMNVTYNSNVSKVRQKIAAQENGKKVFTISFNSDLWDVKPSAGILDSGLYKVEIDTLIVHTLGVSAGMKGTLDKDVNIPYFNIDTLNFLLAGTKFSDFGYCGVGSSTNDGDGDDVVPGDEIYVQYTRTGAIDTAFVTVAIQGGNQSVTYNEGTPAGSTFSVGCGSFRSFLDNTGIGQFTPNNLILVDDSTYTCEVNIRVKADDDPYFAIANKTFTYKHDIDRKAIFALDTAEDRNEKYNNIGIVLNNYDDSLALTYPSAFSVAKAQELGMIDNTDKCVYVILTADPVDETIRVESANQAIDLLSDVVLNSSNYSTVGYGVQDGKLLMAVKVSEPVAENAVVVPAINFALDSVLRWCSVIGASTGVENPYHTYRTYYKVSGETAHDTTKVAYNQMSYRKTGVSGVKLHNTNGQASFMYYPEDYTVWDAQNPTPGLNLDGKVWLALYVAAPNENVKQVYSHPATNTPSGEVSSIVTLADDLANRVTATQAVNYYPVGTCANYANKDYTFYTNERVYENNYLYWFDENGKLLSVQHFNATVKAAPKYTVNFNFNGGGATCNTPYADNFADSTYIFGRKINRPADPFKCGHLFMDWRHGVDSFTVDSFNNVRAGISEATGETVSAEAFGIRSNMVIDAAWKYFVTLSNPHDTAVVADYSLCEISTRDYVWEPTESQLPYVYTFHTDYLGKYYRDYLTAGNANCDVRFEADAFTENPTVLPVGSTSHVTWTVTDMCGTPFTISQNVNVKFPPCGTDNYNPRLYPFTPYETTYKAIDYEGNTYETVRMGCVCWTKENLKSLKYADGEDIPVANAYFDQEENADEFGRLYSWYSAVKLPENSDIEISSLNVDNRPQGVCPTGWYLPRGEDFVRMSDLDIIQGTSSPVKTDGSNNYWLGHEVGDNSTGFSAKPAGFYNPADERYCNLLGDTYFWSSSSTTTITAPCCALTHSCPTILIQNNNKGNGYSVRCIKYKKFDD